MPLQWEDVRYLEAVERLGKVAAAARELGVSVATLYRRVAALEAETGELLLARGGGTVTPVGAAYAQVGRRMRKGLAEVEGERRARTTTVEGEVSLTTVESLLPFIERPIARLLSKFPALQVTLHLGNSGPSVREREVDVALAIMRRPPAGCWGRKLARLPYGVFGTRQALERKGWVVRSPGEGPSEEATWEQEHARPVVARAPFHGVVALVARGVGLGLLPRAMAERHPGLVELTALSASLAPLDRTIWLLTHPDQRKTPRVVALMNELATTFE